ncbi:helix-turn-helix domain-containing protein [Hymenobacter sp. 15J16-1T3B]|uniref:helix-turn-helix domain-containing protein n=1 Tax=Hymenobacter sp. 15J16-1T3B TaxID=2886941 RepID=UPI001D0FC327|nr:helix-turn-helix domain-containing protein [Hymenobacter sp. 15J16-1T3B]MCC3156086.1 helix-turn-helix domain-containing protein [Hymenobacter sp. 15J16-1T3B]
MTHQGEILQEAIKNSGISISRIVQELGITRPTIYRKFKETTLDYNFVKRVGEVIQHDFTQDFDTPVQSHLPFTPVSVTSSVNNVTRSASVKENALQSVDQDPVKALMALQAKYIALLEAYNELLLKVYGPK